MEFNTKDDIIEERTAESVEKSDIEVDDLPNWFIQRIEDRAINQVEEELEDEEDFQLTEDPSSQIQGIVKNIYETLRDNPKPDAFDKFYENSELEEYTHKHLVVEFIEKCFDRLETSNSDIQELNQLDEEELKTEKMDKALKSIADAVNSESELNAVKDIIEEDYPELVSDQKVGMSKDEYIAKQKDFIREEVQNWANGVEPASEFQDFFDEYLAYKEYDIDSISRELNEIIELGVDTWQLLIYAIVSPSLPQYELNGTERRSSFHIMKIGDISTAKSQSIKICKKLAPKYDDPSGWKKANFIGAYDAQEDRIQEGIVDRIQNGTLFVEEFDKVDVDEGTMRIVFDNGKVNEKKAGKQKVIDPVNSNLIVGANPESDFFQEEGVNNMREQIPFTEGTLSRFDAVIPLMNTEADMKEITEGFTIFGGGDGIDFSKMKKAVQSLTKKASTIEDVVLPEAVEIEDDQFDPEQKIKDAFYEKIDTLNNPNRPKLVIMRDLEILIRLVYIDTAIRNDVENGVVEVKGDNIQNATGLFDTIIEQRRKLYEETSRDKVATTTKDEVYQQLVEVNGYADGEGVAKTKLAKKCVKADIIDDKAGAYYHIDNLVEERKVAITNPEKQRGQKVKPVGPGGEE